MPNDLIQSDIEDILSRNYHAHLACCEDGKPYLVPTSYVFHENKLYGYTHPGKKIDILRKHPSVCVEVDDLTDQRWKSVILYGTFEELFGEDMRMAIKLLGQAVSKYHDSLPFIRGEIIQDGPEKDPAILYRINIESMTGRIFE